MVSSVLAMPILSYDALLRLQEHDVHEVDNLMIEWIIMIYCVENNIQSNSVRLRRIYPIMIEK